MVRGRTSDPGRTSISAPQLIELGPALVLTVFAGHAAANPAQPAVAAPAAGPVAEPAHPSAEEVMLRYQAPSECPAQEAFVDAVNQRVRRVVTWTTRASALRMTVTIERAGERASGKLELERRDADETLREFTASSCEEVSSALALVAALALDPNARTDPLPPRPPPTSRGDFPAPPPPAEEPPPPTAVKVALPAAPAPAPAARSADTAGYSTWLGPNAGVMIGYAPVALVSLGFELGARVTRDGSTPSVQLSGQWGKTGSTGPDAESGSFGWTLGRLGVCPFRFAREARVAIEPCLTAEAGRLVARGAESAVLEPVTANRFWLAGGAAVSLHARLDVFFIRFGILGLIPATRDDFVFLSPERRVHRPDPVVYGANLGLGLQLGP